MTKNEHGKKPLLTYISVVGNNHERKKYACFLYYQYFGALVHREANALMERGFNVDIICLRNSYEEPKITHIDGHTLYQIQSRPAAEKSTASYFLNLSLFFVKSLFLVSWLHIRKRYRLIQVFAPPDIMVFAAIIPRILGSKLILVIHDIGPELFMRKLGLGEKHVIIRVIKLLERMSIRFTHHVITVTDPWKDRLVGRSVSSSKCTVVLNVPDERIFKFNPSQIERKDDTAINLFYHGSMEEHFGVDTMLEAMPLIRKQVPNAMLNIYCGKRGRMLDNFLVLVNKLGIDNCVIFNNYVPFNKLPGVLSSADIGLVPTKGGVFSNEAVSMKSLEYMFLGIPIVISGTKAHRYYYDDSFVTFFNPGDVSDFADKVVGICKDTRRRKMQVQNSRLFIEKHSWEQTKKIYYSAIQIVFNNSDFLKNQDY
jgi:glycosyltransferase involved in cell wall biosynthesis